jgi:DNA mismatch repair protein MutL
VMARDRHPVAVLFVTLSPEDVDVNVHPAKAEVRFRDRWQVEQTVERGVRRALGTFDASAMFGRPSWMPSPERAVLDAPTAPPIGVEALQPHSVVDDGLFEPSDDAAAAPVDDRDSRPSSEAQRPSLEVPPLIQLHRTYMMFEHDQGVVLIDQHSAHERVLYEQFMNALDAGAQPAQRLLFPMTLHLGPDEAEAFERHREAFERLGFEIEGFGGHTLLVRAVPMPHPRFDPERCLRETLASLTGDREASAHARHERLAATVACKAAIKAGDALSPGEMRALFIALRDTTLPAHDVHGRATIVQLPWDEIERRFGRR